MKLAVIGGSSLVTFDPGTAFGEIGLSVASSENLTCENKWGTVYIKKFELAKEGVQHTIFFMQQHSHGPDGGIATGITPPHKINYYANIWAIHELKVDFVLATSSVGTIREALPPGRVAVATQYIDFTGAATTFFHDDAHFTSVTDPFDAKMNDLLIRTLRKEQGLPADHPMEFTTWLSTGPHYETKAEVNAIDRMGGDCCGMTAPREAKLCAELSLPFSCLLISSNWAAGRAPGDPTKALNHEEVPRCPRPARTPRPRPRSRLTIALPPRLAGRRHLTADHRHHHQVPDCDLHQRVKPRRFGGVPIFKR